MLCKGGVYLKFIGFLYKRLAGPGKEYEIGFWVRNVTVMRLGDGIMQHHNELAKKIDVRLDSIIVMFALIFFPCK